jgi:hypothetical protein
MLVILEHVVDDGMAYEVRLGYYASRLAPPASLAPGRA